ncbi:hypothetical protein OAB57_01955 [Bacteriovoracaceae bacterium]|nr:hypothetical protein [Bacteriovoracaceae bacterium]
MSAHFFNVESYLYLLEKGLDQFRQDDDGRTPNKILLERGKRNNLNIKYHNQWALFLQNSLVLKRLYHNNSLEDYTADHASFPKRSVRVMGNRDLIREISSFLNTSDRVRYILSAGQLNIWKHSYERKFKEQECVALPPIAFNLFLRRNFDLPLVKESRHPRLQDKIATSVQIHLYRAKLKLYAIQYQEGDNLVSLLIINLAIHKMKSSAQSIKSKIKNRLRLVFLSK